MRLSQDKIEEIRNAVDIVEFINQYVPLKKRGKNYVGLCPFHAERTPSFTVNPDRQLYHCFGCGAGGNLFNFIMEYEKVSFPAALKTVAEYAGIDLSGWDDEFHGAETEMEGLYQANRFAGIYFYKNLTQSPAGKSALEYLYGRGFNDSIIKKFGLGFSLDLWDGLVQYALKRKFDLGLLEKAGLIIRRDDGRYYDRFRNRIMFPIFSVTGRVIAFGGRRLTDDEDVPKYINSPETKVYNKSKVLYGLFQSKEEIRRRGFAILVEGYVDCISLFQAGVENVVASGGTALTGEQIKLLSNYTDTIYFVYDADSAGARAMIRGIDLILEQGLDVYIVQLPQGEDPDSFIKKNGRDKFEKLISSAVTFIDFKTDTYMKLGKLDDPNTRVKAIRSIVESIARMPDELKRSVFIRDTASKYGIPEEVLSREVYNFVNKRKKAVGREDEDLLDRRGRWDVQPEERDLAKLLLESDEHVLELIFRYISPDEIKNDYVRKIYEVVLSKFSDKVCVDVERILSEINDEKLRGFITDVVLSRYEISKFWMGRGFDPNDVNVWEIVRGVLERFYSRRIDLEIRRIQEELRQAEGKGDSELTYKLIVQLNEWIGRKARFAREGFSDVIQKYLESIDKN